MDRRGVSMVLVAMMIFVLMGMAGIAIDYARLYAFKTQLQTAADAAAMAGAVQLVKGPVSNATVYGSATTIGGQNLVEQQAANLSPKCIEWNINAGQRVFPDPIDCTDSRVNAVRVEADYVAQYSLSRIFGASNVTLPAYAVAARGYVGATSCIKPWAVSYQAMLDNLFGPGVKNAATYNLTQQDIQNLIANQAPIPLLFDNNNPTANGNIGQVVVGSPWNGNSSYSQAIVGNCAASNMLIGPGTWLDADPGGGNGQTANPMKQWCGVTGNPATFACNKTATLAIWDIHNGLSGGNLQYRVKYIGVFHVSQFDRATGPNSLEQITGYFTAMSGSGTFTGTPTPIQGKAILVQ